MKSVNVFNCIMMRKSYDQLTSGFERLFELASRNQDLHSKLMCLEIKEYRSFLIINAFPCIEMFQLPT